MSTTQQELAAMIAEALKASTGSLEQLAGEVGVSTETLWAWRNGKRFPNPRNLIRLAKALRRRGAVLTDLAEKIDRAALED
jgi:transcriptional regulator with XRE-family HTH domain